MTEANDADQYGHVRLTVTEPDGQLITEVLPARALPGGLAELLGSPGLVMGAAAGDVLVLQASGFQVVRRGPNDCVQVYADPPLDDHAMAWLAKAFEAAGGYVEAPPQRQFAVVTVPSAAGREQVEAIMAEAGTQIPGLEWQFGTA
ncbi:hypothetical protein Cme02nite_07040 [Catellatospora methionotrophica]|uniref:DUF4265 domain-containing protein n=1 Tax=Catellatospora methionotrophica TaxID=121620 RepID=A0A8J3L0J9_9ACTN|nr:DUF4265 domain-containing protein [Catellatospora methionotrophica]GIG12372.1 hypothetical protein Cme02nite_07040 [Catellatospora methionotrophica]